MIVDGGSLKPRGIPFSPLRALLRAPLATFASWRFTFFIPHLGSADVILTGLWNGSAFANHETERQSFDAWGERRAADTLVTYRATDSDPFRTSARDYDRGYTGHEQLDDCGLLGNPNTKGAGADASRASIVGGTVSALGGGKFANGAWTASFQHLLSETASHLESSRSDERLGYNYQEKDASCLVACTKNAIEAEGGVPPTEARLRAMFDDLGAHDWDSGGSLLRESANVLAKLG
jgi:hypothetical protein